MKDALHTAWAKLLMGALGSAGVKHVVVSPGSRSTALALAAEHTPDLTVTPVIDERSADFFALGQARMTGIPTVLVCTSGSAGAHYLPAVIESAQSRCPLIVITADRPPELQDCSSNQTIRQQGIFGSYPRADFDLGVPDIPALPAVARYAAQAVHSALFPDPGPVHINAPFRKPLEPTPTEDAAAHTAARELLKRPHRWFPPVLGPSDAAARELAEKLQAAKRALIVAGPLLPAVGVLRTEATHHLSRSVCALARAAGAVIFAESTSGIDPHLDAEGGTQIPLIKNFESLSRAAALTRDAAPDLIVELGAPPVSDSYAAFLRAHPETCRITIASAGHPNPTNLATTLIRGDVVQLFDRAREMPGFDPPARGRGEWLKTARDLARLGNRAAAAACEGDTLSEAAVARTLTRALPAGSSLVIGNSLCVRDLDLFGGLFEHSVNVVHQRGASGIDGLVATAAGVRSVAPRDEPDAAPVVACIGDVSALHDVGSLALLSPSRRRARVAAPLVLLVVNNGGGRIFAELPVASVPPSELPGIDEALEQLFFTPTGDFLQGVAQGFGIAYERVSERSALRVVIDVALREKRATLVEVFVPPEDGTQRRARLRERITEELRALNEEAGGGS